MTISNYYVKGKASNGEEVTIGIEDDCVFTTCPVCGKEHTVDIVELAASGDFDLYGSAIYCPECAARRTRRSKREWAARNKGRP